MAGATPVRHIGAVRVDRNRCFSHERCVAIAPDVFALDDEAISTVGDIALVDDERLLQVAEACPAQAILLFGDDGQQFYPASDTAW